MQAVGKLVYLLLLILFLSVERTAYAVDTHHTTPPEAEHTPRFSSSSTLPVACIRIVNHLTPQAPAFFFSVKAFAQYQEDITGKSTYTAPTHAGIRLEVPLYDARERWQMKKEYIRALDFARRILANYLKLRYEVEEMRKYVKWQWQRVQAGIEYRKDIWKEEIKLKQLEGELKALTSLLVASGVSEELLGECYEGKSK